VIEIVGWKAFFGLWMYAVFDSKSFGHLLSKFKHVWIAHRLFADIKQIFAIGGHNIIIGVA